MKKIRFQCASCLEWDEDQLWCAKCRAAPQNKAPQDEECIPWGLPPKLRTVEQIARSIVMANIDTYGQCDKGHEVIHVYYDGLKDAIISMVRAASDRWAHLRATNDQLRDMVLEYGERNKKLEARIEKAAELISRQHAAMTNPECDYCNWLAEYRADKERT
jgi:hypothetical protein